MQIWHAKSSNSSDSVDAVWHRLLVQLGPSSTGRSAGSGLLDPTGRQNDGPISQHWHCPTRGAIGAGTIQQASSSGPRVHTNRFAFAAGRLRCRSAVLNGILRPRLKQCDGTRLLEEVARDTVSTGIKCSRCCRPTDFPNPSTHPREATHRSTTTTYSIDFLPASNSYSHARHHSPCLGRLWPGCPRLSWVRTSPFRRFSLPTSQRAADNPSAGLSPPRPRKAPSQR